jgi:hypothetical protein
MLAKKRGKEHSAKVNRRLHWLAHVGYASRSLLFLSIGILALLAAYDARAYGWHLYPGVRETCTTAVIPTSSIPNQQQARPVQSE